MDTGIIEAEKFVYARLKASFPTRTIAPENTETKPVNDSFFSVSLVINDPTDPVRVKGYHRENLIAVIEIHTPLNKGTGEARNIGLQVRNAFEKGTTSFVGNNRMHVLTTPRISGGGNIQGRYLTTVSVPITVEVYNY